MALYSETDMQAFDGNKYLGTRFSGQPSEVRRQFLDNLHGIYSKYSSTWDSNTARMLEFGGGPTLYGLISASPFVRDITFSDFAESNRKEVELWKSRDKKGHNWLPFFEYVVTTLEACTEPNAAAKREEEVRQKIKEIVFCDLRSDNPLPDASFEMFDIISVLGCIECCSDTISEFELGVKKLADMLNPNGYLIGRFVLGGTWWSQGDSADKDPKLAILTLEAEDVDRAMEKAGLTVLEKQTIADKSDSVHYSLKGRRFVVARKKT